ncbi:MAG TPA: hypothetical protein VM115_13835 [Vicinamibacterales bacterium]|nr:hypothetical protein [Vicinamibacterales bacterium]
MTTHRTGVWAVLALALILVFGWNTAGIAQTRGEPEHFTASFVDLNTGRAGPVQMSVTRWTTESERAAFQQALFKKGQTEALDVFRDSRSVGRIYTPGNIGYDLRYAESKALPDGGREIILATDRPMSFREITTRPLSSEYPFTWVQFKIRPDGTGEGKLFVAARIIGEEADDLIEVEDFAITPVRLQNITSRKGN